MEALWTSITLKNIWFIIELFRLCLRKTFLQYYFTKSSFGQRRTDSDFFIFVLQKGSVTIKVPDHQNLMDEELENSFDDHSSNMLQYAICMQLFIFSTKKWSSIEFGQFYSNFRVTFCTMMIWVDSIRRFLSKTTMQHDSCSGRLYTNWFVFRLWKLSNRGILVIKPGTVQAMVILYQIIRN